MVGLIPRREDFNMSFKLSDEIAAMKRRISIDFTLQKSLIANRLRELKNPFAAKKTNKEVIQTINSMRELLDKMEKTLGMESYK